VGIDPIEYTVWKDKKTPFRKRFLVISEKIFRKKLRSKAIWILLIIGYILVHVFTISSAPFFPPEELTKELILYGEGTLIGEPYLKGGLFFIFTILLVSVVSSDILSQDIRESSFVLYFSRPLRTVDYISGKIFGGLSVMSLYCAIPPILVGISVIATQTGDNYLGSFQILGLTIVAGIFTSFLYLPYAVLLSSLTERKAYSGIGTFMTFFVLTIVSELFTTFDPNWKLIGPENLLHFSYDVIYGIGLPEDVSLGLYIMAMIALIILPLIALYIRIRRKEVEG